MNEPYEFPSSPMESLRAEASHLGAKRPERAWILTDRDVWMRNPYYRGPAVPHPELDDAVYG
jgi:hypothetical protein